MENKVDKEEEWNTEDFKLYQGVKVTVPNTIEYYTPNLADFYIGFEYESLVDYYKNEFKTFVIEDMDDLNSTLNSLDDQGLEYARVKYLTKEDIEDCGFERDIESSSGNYVGFMRIFIIPEYHFREYYIKQQTHSRDLKTGEFVHRLDKVTIYCRHYFKQEDGKYITTPKANGEIVFEGKIKNKSELKKVLKMVGL